MRKNDSDSWMAANAFDDCQTSPNVMRPANSPWACTSQGSGLIAWLIVTFQPKNSIIRCNQCR